MTAVAGVQSTYYDAILLAAVVAGALAVASRRRQWRRAVLCLGIGAVAASWLAFLVLRAVGRHYRRPPSLADAVDAARRPSSDYHI